ncbi:uncharacterized protein LOC108677622 [Hyalella azteca]|uniref:Uncharacterized protein LOC108677622 n=1 Tax=Hyalella azteca TaxID=294128 RepID=A0A8B7P621_HYAAZ|nr:uncharacterized protein LOC108677622 [Hyalella azteca]
MSIRTTIRITLYVVTLLDILSCGESGYQQQQFLPVQAKTFHKSCLLGNVDMSSYPDNSLALFDCGKQCMLRDNCRLFCFNSGTMSCDLLECFVSQWFPGVTPSSNTATFKTCYSSWADARDIIRSNMTVSGSPGHQGTLPINAIDGYYCGYAWPKYIFIASSSQPNYLQINFGSVVKVAEVIINHPTNAEYFKSVVVRLGNSSIEANTAIIATLAPGALSGFISIINLPTPVPGQFLHLRSMNTDYFQVNEVQVIRAD